MMRFLALLQKLTEIERCSSTFNGAGFTYFWRKSADISILLVYIEQGKIARIEPINSKEILLDEHRTISIYAEEKESPSLLDS